MKEEVHMSGTIMNQNNISNELQQTNELLKEILSELRTLNKTSHEIRQKLSSGIRMQEPVIVEVDGIVSVVGH